MLCASVFAGASLPAANASPAASATALSHLKADWNKKSAQVRKGTCAEYAKWPNTTVVDATNKAWGVKANRKSMTIAEWLKVYKSFYKWAC
jgi:tRNA A37 threonylcarbamoyladenosine synthetase subunit TsaC/SUA5/YrdC